MAAGSRAKPSKAFGDYSGHVAKALSDRVRHFFTINEFSVFVELGHRGIDTTADGKPRKDRACARTAARARRAQSGSASCGARRTAWRCRPFALRGGRAPRVGPAENISVAVPVIENAAHVKAAEAATRDLNAPYLGVILDGRYSDAYLAAAGKDAPVFTDEDLRIISSPLDFVGINVYRPSVYVVASGQSPGYRVSRKVRPIRGWRRTGSCSDRKCCIGGRGCCIRSGT